MVKAINFDMDGTLCDFYGVDNWLAYLVNKERIRTRLRNLV